MRKQRRYSRRAKRRFDPVADRYPDCDPNAHTDRRNTDCDSSPDDDGYRLDQRVTYGIGEKFGVTVALIEPDLASEPSEETQSHVIGNPHAVRATQRCFQRSFDSRENGSALRGGRVRNEWD